MCIRYNDCACSRGHLQAAATSCHDLILIGLDLDSCLPQNWHTWHWKILTVRAEIDRDTRRSLLQKMRWYYLVLGLHAMLCSRPNALLCYVLKCQPQHDLPSEPSETGKSCPEHLHFPHLVILPHQTWSFLPLLALVLLE